MDKDTIIKFLTEYSFNKGRSEYLKIAILQQRRHIENLKSKALSEGILPGNCFAGTVRAVGVSDRTADLVTGVLSGQYPPYIQKEIDELEKLEEERHIRSAHIASVDVLIQGLTEKESFVIKERYIQECTWPELVRRFEVAFVHYSVEGLKGIHHRAINKMVQIAS